MEFIEAAVRRNIRAARPGMEVFKLSAKIGEGMTEFLEYREHRRARSRGRRDLKVKRSAYSPSSRLDFFLACVTPGRLVNKSLANKLINSS